MLIFTVNLLAFLCCILPIFATNEQQKQKIYYGEAELIDQLLTNTSDWTFVRQNIDGFYVNFIEIDSILTLDELKRFFELLSNKSVYFESDADPSHQPLEKDKIAIEKFHQVGWNITYTSQNYGWTVERDEILAYYNLTEHVTRRPDFVQLGPWTLSGNISNDPGTGPYSNAQYRAWIHQSDGVSTDGPLGYWQIDFQQMREGSYSVVHYAHSIGKTAAVMLCPYGAGVVTYNSTRDFVNVGISAIREHEDHEADPDIWIIFEYADSSIPAIPEQINGLPANSTTGMAYYALKHRDGEPNTLDLYMDDTRIGRFVNMKSTTEADITLNASVPVDTTFNYTIFVANHSPWLDYAAWIRIHQYSSVEQIPWQMKCSIDGNDVTDNILSITGYTFIKQNRLWPNTIQTLNIFFTRTSYPPENMTIIIELAPHRGSDVVDSIRFDLLSS